jgi:hypothetical protein
MNARLSTIGSIGHCNRSRFVPAQETSQADEPQEAEEAPVAGIVVIPGLGARRGRRLPVCPAGACASATEGDTTAMMAARSNTTANTVRLQDGDVMGFPSIAMGSRGTSASFRTGIKDS